MAIRPRLSSTDLVVGDGLEVSNQMTGRLEGKFDPGPGVGRPRSRRARNKSKTVWKMSDPSRSTLRDGPMPSCRSKSALDRPAEGPTVPNDKADRLLVVVLQPLDQLDECRLGHDFGCGAQGDRCPVDWIPDDYHSRLGLSWHSRSCQLPRSSASAYCLSSLVKADRVESGQGISSDMAVAESFPDPYAEPGRRSVWLDSSAGSTAAGRSSGLTIPDS